jgi:carboxyl-terminal processing protease
LLRLTATKLVLGGALLLSLAGCAGLDTAGPYDLPSPSAQFFTLAYQRVTDFYIRPVKLEDCVVSGLGNLKRIDNRIAVSRSAGHLLLAYGDLPVTSQALPQFETAGAWAKATVAAINTLRERSSALRIADPEAIHASVLEGITFELDRLSRYETRNASLMREESAAPGISLLHSNGALRISRVFEGVASSQPVFVNDEVIAIDGIPTEGMRYLEANRRMRGPLRTAVVVTLKRAGTPGTTDVQLIRQLRPVEATTYQRNGNVAVLRLRSFNRRAAQGLEDMVQQAIQEMGADAGRIILDLRGNSGGLLDQAIEISDLFLTEGEIMSARGRHRASNYEHRAKRGGAGEQVPLVVLVNGSSAAASEVVALALQANGRAVVVGSTTHGSATVQTVSTLPTGGSWILTWTMMKGPAGLLYDERGIIPTLCTAGLPLPDLRQAQAQAKQGCPQSLFESDADMTLAYQVLNDLDVYRGLLGR